MPTTTPSRILHVINSLAIGGAERLVAGLLPRLRARGLDPRLFVLDARGDAFSGSLRASGVEVFFARPHGADPYSPARLADVRDAIDAIQPELVHSHLAPSFHWCALAVPPRRGIALVATEHASANRRMRMPLVRGIERLAYGRYDAVACVSDDARVAIERWLPGVTSRLRSIPNGVDATVFANAQPAADVVAAFAGRKGVAMTARFVPEKDHATAIRVAARLPEDVTLVLVGDGPGLPAAKNLAAELGASAKIMFLGARTDVPAVLAACSVYLQTSLVEGFGLAALEAMAAGLPVAASEVPGLGPLVGGAGVLVPPGDDERFASALASLLEPGPARGQCVRAGLERVRSHSLDTVAERYVALYREALAMRSR